MSTTSTRRFPGHRTAVIVAAAVGFVAGGAGLVAAGRAGSGADDGPSSSAVSVSVDDSPSSSTPASTPVTVDDSPSSSAPASTPVTVDDSSSSSAPASTPVTVDDSSSSSAPASTPVTVDDSPSSSMPGSSVPAGNPLPAPFTTTYHSTGGSITVTWTGTAFVLDGVSPAAGYAAEIEDQRGDRIRVDFEGDSGDARIEVRISDDDNSVRVRID